MAFCLRSIRGREVTTSYFRCKVTKGTTPTFLARIPRLLPTMRRESSTQCLMLRTSLYTGSRPCHRRTSLSTPATTSTLLVQTATIGMCGCETGTRVLRRTRGERHTFVASRFISSTEIMMLEVLERRPICLPIADLRRQVYLGPVHSAAAWVVVTLLPFSITTIFR